MDWTQIITMYKGPLHIINNYNSTCVSNSKIQYTKRYGMSTRVGAEEFFFLFSSNSADVNLMDNRTRIP